MNAGKQKNLNITEEDIDRLICQTIGSQVIAIPRIYFEMIEDWEVILVLSQIVNWYLYEYKGEFCKTDAEMVKFFKIKNMTKWERLKRKLKKLPFLTIESRGMPPKTFYKVNNEKLLNEITKVNL